MRYILTPLFIPCSLSLTMIFAEANALPGLDSADAMTKNLNTDSDSVTQSTDTQNAKLHVSLSQYITLCICPC